MYPRLKQPQNKKSMLKRQFVCARVCVSLLYEKKLIWPEHILYVAHGLDMEFYASPQFPCTEEWLHISFFIINLCAGF